MKRLMFAAMVAAAAFAPIAGRADVNRLNLWPLVGYNDGAFDFIWPLGHFKDTDEWRFFPVIREHDLFCVFPEFWFTDDGFAVLPLAAEYDFGEGTLFPVLWWDLEGSDKMHSVFPAYYYHGNDHATTFWAFCGLAGFDRRDGKLRDHRFLPLYLWDDGDFYSLPYSRHTDGGRVKSRFFCGFAGCDSNADGDYQSSWLFPIYSHDKRKGEFITPLYGQTKDASWLIPLYYHDESLTLTPLFGKKAAAHWTLPLYYKDKEKFLTLIGGKDGDTDWVVPFYWRDKRTFASLPYWRQLGKDGEIDRAFSIPLLSGYERDHKSGNRLLYLLMGLGGHVWNDETGDASWVFPLFYKDRESFYTLLYGHNPRRTWLFPVYFDGEERTYITPLYGRNKKTGADWLIPLYYRNKETFVTPLYGKSGNADWLFPLYCRDESQFNSPVYSYWDDAKKGTRGFFSLPLLSGANWETNSCDKTWFTLAGLVGGSSNASGSHKANWALPLFVREENESFYSIPFGWSGGGSGYTNTYFAAGLAGVKSGRKEGGWLFPLFNREKDASFDKDHARLDSRTIPEDIVFKDVVHSWTNNAGKVETWTNFVASVDVSSRIRGSVLLGSDHDSSVYGRIGERRGKHGGRGDRKTYELEEHSKQGNRIIFNRESSRTVAYDIDSRERLGERTSSETMALCGLVYDNRECDSVAETSHARTRILWKLWDREEREGNVTVDAFPGFTYDSKTNGYSKTSFLWRFFRYENDPEKGKKVDLLFIPVWR
ncbi:MAG: hypothetical protein IKQ17_06970 [Kiritimatiellae bacterium]|nr:hypothetical protein [Kiritimatiellia bacterium]